MPQPAQTMRYAPYGGSAEEWKAWAEELPASAAMGFRCLEIDAGHVVIEVADTDFPINPNGAVHGGMVLAWADHVCGILATTAVGEGASPATASLTAQFLRPAFLPLRIEGTVERSGRTLSFLTITVTSGDGRPATLLTATMSVDGTSRFLPDAPTP